MSLIPYKIALEESTCIETSPITDNIILFGKQMVLTFVMSVTLNFWIEKHKN